MKGTWDKSTKHDPTEFDDLFEPELSRKTRESHAKSPTGRMKGTKSAGPVGWADEEVHCTCTKTAHVHVVSSEYPIGYFGPIFAVCTIYVQMYII